MADKDEESAFRAEPDAADVDISDEVQDFRLLGSFSQYILHLVFDMIPH